MYIYPTLHSFYRRPKSMFLSRHIADFEVKVAFWITTHIIIIFLKDLRITIVEI
jgi:hypothetical protein